MGHYNSHEKILVISLYEKKKKRKMSLYNKSQIMKILNRYKWNHLETRLCFLLLHMCWLSNSNRIQVTVDLILKLDNSLTFLWQCHITNWRRWQKFFTKTCKASRMWTDLTLCTNSATETCEGRKNSETAFSYEGCDLETYQCQLLVNPVTKNSGKTAYKKVRIFACWAWCKQITLYTQCIKFLVKRCLKIRPCQIWQLVNINKM